MGVKQGIDAFWALTFNEKVTLVIALGSLHIAAATLFISIRADDTQKAVSQLAELAKQTKRQADQLEDQSRLARIAASQKFRTISMTALPLPLPTEPGGAYAVGFNVFNDGDSPVAIAANPFSIAFTDGDPGTRAAEMFKSLEAQLSPVPAFATLAPGQGIAETNRGRWPKIHNLERLFQNTDASVVIVGLVRYPDPLGNLHHEYICRFSNRWHRDQICATPRSD